jgi:hypothetical protein
MPNEGVGQRGALRPFCHHIAPKIESGELSAPDRGVHGEVRGVGNVDEPGGAAFSRNWLIHRIDMRCIYDRRPPWSGQDWETDTLLTFSLLASALRHGLPSCYPRVLSRLDRVPERKVKANLYLRCDVEFGQNDTPLLYLSSH